MFGLIPYLWFFHQFNQLRLSFQHCCRLILFQRNTIINIYHLLFWNTFLLRSKFLFWPNCRVFQYRRFTISTMFMVMMYRWQVPRRSLLINLNINDVITILSNVCNRLWCLKLRNQVRQCDSRMTTATLLSVFDLCSIHKLFELSSLLISYGINLNFSLTNQGYIS